MRHQRQCLLDREEGAFQINRHDFIEHRLGDFRNRHKFADAGVDEKRVGSLELVANLCHRSIQIRDACGICADRQSAAADFLLSILQCPLIAARNSHLRTLTRKGFGSRQSNTTISAGYHRDFPFKTFHKLLPGLVSASIDNADWSEASVLRFLCRCDLEMSSFLTCRPGQLDPMRIYFAALHQNKSENYCLMRYDVNLRFRGITST